MDVSHISALSLAWLRHRFSLPLLPQTPRRPHYYLIFPDQISAGEGEASTLCIRCDSFLSRDYNRHVLFIYIYTR